MRKIDWTEEKLDYLKELTEQKYNNQEITDKINAKFNTRHSKSAIIQRKSLSKVINGYKKTTFKEDLVANNAYDEFIDFARTGRGTSELENWLSNRNITATPNQLSHFLKLHRISRLALTAQIDKTHEKYQIIQNYYKGYERVNVSNFKRAFWEQPNCTPPADLNKAVRDMEGLGMLRRLNDKQVSFQ